MFESNDLLAPPRAQSSELQVSGGKKEAPLDLGLEKGTGYFDLHLFFYI